MDKNDKAFQNPTKPIGGFMDEAEAKQRQKDLGWSVVEDAGRGWRRVVASPIPEEVVELDSVKALIDAGQWLLPLVVVAFRLLRMKMASWLALQQ